MPDILIRGMEMPTGCAACDFYNVISGRCTRTGTKINFSELTTRSVDCPISELPPHGDLIDRDYIQRTLQPYSKEDEQVEVTLGTAKRLIQNAINAPVVVPAERRDADA